MFADLSMPVALRSLVLLGWALALGWAILFSPVRASGQELPAADSATRVVAGDRVRLESPLLGGARREALVMALRGDTLVVSGTFRPGGSQETALIPFSAVRSLEVSAGTKSNAWKGAKIGAGSGAVFGLAMGVLAVEDTKDSFMDYGAAYIPVGIVSFGLIGGLVGTGIGALSRGEAWERVEPARLRVEPREGGAAIVASLPLRF